MPSAGYVTDWQNLATRRILACMERGNSVIIYHSAAWSSLQAYFSQEHQGVIPATIFKHPEIPQDRSIL